MGKREFKSPGQPLSIYLNRGCSRKEKIVGVTNFPNGLTMDTTKCISLHSGSAVPATGTAGYNPGCKFILSNASLGQCMEWVNIGSTTSCTFVPAGAVFGYGIFGAGGPVTSAGGDTAESISLQGIAMDTDIAIVGHEVSDDNDQIVAAISNEGSIDITVSADPSTAHGYVYALLRNKCVPQWDIVAAGTHTCVGGSAAEAITVTGALATDIPIVIYNTSDDTDTILKAVVTADTLTVTCSADPGDTHKLAYLLLRAY